MNHANHHKRYTLRKRVHKPRITKNQQPVYDYIKANPGLSLTKIYAGILGKRRWDDDHKAQCMRIKALVMGLLRSGHIMAATGEVTRWHAL